MLPESGRATPAGASCGVAPQITGKDWLPQTFTVPPAPYHISSLSIMHGEPEVPFCYSCKAAPYTAPSGLHWKPDWFVFPLLELWDQGSSVSLRGCLPRASRVIPPFRGGVYCSGDVAFALSLRSSGTALHRMPCGFPGLARTFPTGD